MSFVEADSSHQQMQRARYYFNDKVFKYMGDTYCWVAGGALRGFFTDGYVKSDIDIFFNDEEDFNKGADMLRGIDGANQVFESDRVLRIHKGKDKYDLVKRFFDTPEDCISQFDFTVACCAIDYDKIIHHKDFFVDLSTKKLIVNDIPYPLSTFRRVQKYNRKGFSICNGGILQIAKALSEIDYDNPDENFMEFYPDGTPKYVSID